MAETITAGVRRGAALLDRKLPGWHTRINLNTLDLNDCEACILGQLYGKYSYGLEVLLVGDQFYLKRYHYGFSSLRVRGKDKGMRRLTATWARLVAKRILSRFGIGF